MMPSPWEKYQQASPAAPPAPTPNAPPAFIPGTVPASKQAEQARAADDQVMQREQLRLSQEASQRATAGDVRQQQEFEGTAGKPAEGDKKAASFLIRALGSNAGFEATGEKGRSIFAQSFQEFAPDISNTIANSGSRQVSDTAQKEFIAAVLRLDSGAAIPPEEENNYKRLYFPQPGDGDAVLEYKRQARERAIAGLRLSAGPIADKAQASFDALQAQFDGQAAGGIEQDYDENGNPVPPGYDGGVFDKDGNYLGLSGTITDTSPIDPNAAPDGSQRVDGNDPGYMQFAAGVGDIVQGGFNNTVGLLANPVNATINEVAGTNLSTDLGGVLRDAMGLPYGDETIGAINQAASGAGLTAVGARAAGNAATGLARNALLEYGSRPGLDLATGATAAASGETARALGASPAVQMGATLLGGSVPSAATAGRAAMSGSRAAPTAEQRAVISAGERRNVPVRQADVRPEVRGQYGTARTSEQGGPIIRDAEANDIQAMERSVANDVAGGRSSVGREGVGNAGATAVNRRSDAMRNEARVWYKRADKAAGDVTVEPTEGLKRLDDTIATLKSNGANSNKNTITYLEGIRDDFANGLTISGLRDQRTNMRANIREAGLDLNKTEALMQDIIEGASTDIQRGLGGKPAALNAYKKADKLWAERAAFTKEIKRTLLGPKGDKSPEAVADGIKRLARDDFGKLKQFWDVLEPDEQADIAATFAISQGRDIAGNWSPARFVSDLTGDDLGTKAAISPKAMRLMYGEEGMQAINDLKAIAGAKKAATSEVNRSNTGNTVQRTARGLRTLILGGMGLATGGPVGAMAAPAAGNWFNALGDKRAARLLLNPDFTKWLKNAPEATNPQAINTYFKQLESSASKSAIFAGDVKALQESLVQSFGQSPIKAAASEKEPDGREPPPQ